MSHLTLSKAKPAALFRLGRWMGFAVKCECWGCYGKILESVARRIAVDEIKPAGMYS